SEHFDEHQVVDAIARTDYDQPIARQRRVAPPPAPALPPEGGLLPPVPGGLPRAIAAQGLSGRTVQLVVGLGEVAATFHSATNPRGAYCTMVGCWSAGTENVIHPRTHCPAATTCSANGYCGRGNLSSFLSLAAATELSSYRSDHVFQLTLTVDFTLGSTQTCTSAEPHV